MFNYHGIGDYGNHRLLSSSPALFIASYPYAVGPISSVIAIASYRLRLSSSSPVIGIKMPRLLSPSPVIGYISPVIAIAGDCEQLLSSAIVIAWHRQGTISPFIGTPFDEALLVPCVKDQNYRNNLHPMGFHRLLWPAIAKHRQASAVIGSHRQSSTVIDSHQQQSTVINSHQQSSSSPSWIERSNQLVVR